MHSTGVVMSRWSYLHDLDGSASVEVSEGSAKAQFARARSGDGDGKPCTITSCHTCQMDDARSG